MLCPTPKKTSENIQPPKILPRARKNNGAIINISGSCACSKCFLKPLGAPIKVK
jgi:hypothetical protein